MCQEKRGKIINASGEKRYLQLLAPFTTCWHMMVFSVWENCWIAVWRLVIGLVITSCYCFNSVSAHLVRVFNEGHAVNIDCTAKKSCTTMRGKVLGIFKKKGNNINLSKKMKINGLVGCAKRENP